MKNFLLKALDLTAFLFGMLLVAYVLGMAYVTYYDHVVFGDPFWSEFGRALLLIF